MAFYAFIILEKGWFPELTCTVLLLISIYLQEYSLRNLYGADICMICGS